jgi:ATP-dependent DNA ligase
MLRKSADRRPSGFIEPCRPTKASLGALWVHEIKHEGFRLMVRREGSRVRCFTRGGYDWADRFPAIVAPQGVILPDRWRGDCLPAGWAVRL